MFHITWHVKNTNESYSTYDALNKLAIMYAKKEEEKTFAIQLFSSKLSVNQSNENDRCVK